jgi:uncharacterized membrane protein
MTTMPREDRATYATERLAALSDGVFAIVLTLLVLDLQIPRLPGGFSERELIADLRDQIPNFVAWVISFVLVARFWIAHHAVVASLARCDIETLVWNFVVLGLVSLVPYAASLIGAYELDPVAVAVFAVMLGSTGAALGLFARLCAGKTRLHRAGAPVELVRRYGRYHFRVLPGLAVLSLAALAVNELLALAIMAMEPAVAVIAARRGR